MDRRIAGRPDGMGRPAGSGPGGRVAVRGSPAGAARGRRFPAAAGPGGGGLRHGGRGGRGRCGAGKGFGKWREEPAAAREAGADDVVEYLPLVQEADDGLDDGFEDDGPPVDDVPDGLADRMLARMVGFAVVPLLVGFGFFPLFYYLKVVRDVAVPTWVVYIVTGFFFGGSLLGISYGALSTSPVEGGSGGVLGVDTFRRNFDGLLGDKKPKPPGPWGR